MAHDRRGFGTYKDNVDTVEILNKNGSSSGNM